MYAGPLTYPPNPIRRSVLERIKREARTEANSSVGILNHDADGFREITTLGICTSSNPANGTREFSNPLLVPINTMRSFGCVIFQHRATASAGSICPAVPPPAKTIVAILGHSSLTLQKF